MLLFDDDLLDNETDVIKSDGKRSIIYDVYGCLNIGILLLLYRRP